MLIRTATTILLLLLFFLAAITYPVWAKESTKPATIRKERAGQRVETVKEKISTREAVLKAKLQTFKDQKKATATARISDNLNRINAKQTEQMLKHLDKMTSILNRLDARVNEGRPDIKDASRARVAISDARASIASATAAVNDQAGKDYTVTILNEGTARSDIKAVRDRLHSNLQSVRKLVTQAKQTVGNAIRVAKSGKVEIPGKEGTPGATQ